MKDSNFGIFIKTIGLVFIVVLVGLFQNCSGTGFSFIGTDGEDTQKSGNGDSYTGLQPLDGLYYSIQLDYLCQDSSQAPLYEHVMAIIEVSSSAQKIEVTDSCSRIKTELKLSDLSLSENDLRYLGYDGGLYRLSSEVPNQFNLDAYPILRCHSDDLANGSSNGNEYLVERFFVDGPPIFAAKAYNPLINGGSTNYLNINQTSDAGSFIYETINFRLTVPTNGALNGTFSGTMGPPEILVDENIICEKSGQ